MIKHLNEITEKELEYMKSHPVTVYEKLDLPYFKVEIDYESVKLYTAKGRLVDDVDKIVNSMYKDIAEFVDSHIALNYDDILNTFGYTRLGFFYKPATQSNTIEYNVIPNGSFILNEFYVFDKETKDVDKLKDIIGSCFYEQPLIKEISCLPDMDVYSDPVELINEIVGKNVTWSKEPTDKIEGVILSYRNGKKKYKVIANSVDPEIDMTTLKLYRDFIIEDFAKIMVSRDYITDVEFGTPYIDMMSDLFLKYIDESDLLSRTYIEPEDLLPPKNGYIGDVDFSKLPSTVAIVCKSNEVFKNMLRILLVAFNNGVSEYKFKGFDGEAKKNIIQTLSEINNKREKN